MPLPVCMSRSIGRPVASIALVIIPAVCGAQAYPSPGRAVTIVLDQTVTSRSYRPGDEVRLHTDGDVTIDGRFVPSGSAVTGSVIHAKRGSRMRRPGELEIGGLAVVGSDGVSVAVSEAVIRALPPAHSYRDFYARQAAAEGRILTGMAAGYGGAWIASHWSRSEETVAATGLLSGVAAIGLMQVLPRGPDLQLSRGATFSFVFRALPR